MHRRHSEPAGDEPLTEGKAMKRLSLEPKSPRIPKSLQNVFLAAARGEKVVEPPTDRSGSRTFKKSTSWRKTKKPPVQLLKGTSLPLVMEGASSSSTAVTSRQSEDPQAYLDKLLASRGYSTRRFRSLDCAYHCKPSELQQASYGIQVVKAVRDGDVRLLKTLLDAGLSPSPCNMYGESLMHLVCRRGDHSTLDAMLQYGCTLQISDDYGRTPLHDACWTSSPDFETIKLVLGEDVRLLYITDARDATPLSYVSRDSWSQWIDFIDAIKDSYWPPRDINVVGFESPPFLTQREPHSVPVRDPWNALETDVAFKVAAGQIQISDLLYCLTDDDDDDASVSTTDSEESSNHRSSADYDDDNFLTPEEIAMTLAKYDEAKYLQVDNLVEGVIGVRTTTESIL